MAENGNEEVVTVAEQKAVGVPAEETVTVADQKAGTAAPDLSDTDREELERYRAGNQPANTTKEEKPLPDTHWLHLADGNVITAKGVAGSVDGIPVIHAIPIPEELQDGEPTEVPHRF